MSLASKKEHLEKYQLMLKDALQGKVPEKHKEKIKQYISFLSKEVALMEYIINDRSK